jgi:hypothetical protein
LARISAPNVYISNVSELQRPVSKSKIIETAWLQLFTFVSQHKKELNSQNILYIAKKLLESLREYLQYRSNITVCVNDFSMDHCLKCAISVLDGILSTSVFNDDNGLFFSHVYNIVDTILRCLIQFIDPSALLTNKKCLTNDVMDISINDIAISPVEDVNDLLKRSLRNNVFEINAKTLYVRHAKSQSTQDSAASLQRVCSQGDEEVGIDDVDDDSSVEDTNDKGNSMDAVVENVDPYASLYSEVDENVRVCDLSDAMKRYVMCNLPTYIYVL